MDKKEIDLTRLANDREFERMKGELEKANLANDRDFERMKGEFEKAKFELEQFKSSLSQMVADAKVQIGDLAVNKMTIAFTYVRNIVLFAVVLFGVAGVLSLSQISSMARKTIETRIIDWLSFEKKGAILKETLENIRMEVVLDSLVIKMERARLSGLNHIPLPLNEVEKGRLITYMEDPATSVFAFRDGARVLAAHIGNFYQFNDPKIDDLLAKILTSFKSDDERPTILLETLKYYGPIRTYAKAFLKRDDLPSRTRFAAFGALSKVDSDEAASYSAAHLLSESHLPLQEAEAKILARRENAVQIVDEWLAKHLKTDGGALAFVSLAEKLVSDGSPSFSFSSNSAHQEWALNRTAQLMISAITNGAHIYLAGQMPSDAELVFKANGSFTLRQPDSLLYHGDILLKAMAITAEKVNLVPEIFIKALTTRGARGEIFALQAQLNAASMKGVAFGLIDQSTVSGPVMLLSKTDKSGTAVYASFRARDGRWIEDRVLSFSQFYSATLGFAYDELILQMATRRINANFGEFD